MSHQVESIIALFQSDRYQGRYQAIRRDLHAHPETAYEEYRTSDRVAAELQAYGFQVHRGLARTGVVGVLRHGTSSRSLGLRADIDALPITELTNLPYQSTIPGKMHACGHDGHTAMLLLAARYLSETRQFDGTLVVIFQPAEERGGGARTMIAEGLFDQFPVDQVYGMHNIPGIPVGQFAVMPGPMMASGDYFRVTIRATGGHAALPHTTPDPILAGSALVQALQSLVSRAIDPLEPAVLSVTQFHGGEATNVIPALVTIEGTARSYSAATQTILADGLERISRGIAASYGVDITPEFVRGYPATINDPQAAAFVRQALRSVVGAEHVLTLKPLMTAEDFSYMLLARPGAYLWIGNGPSSGLHTPHYNFNDELLPFGAAAWVALVEQALVL